QAEDGIRDFHVTGVQTCALPISRKAAGERRIALGRAGWPGDAARLDRIRASVADVRRVLWDPGAGGSALGSLFSAARDGPDRTWHGRLVGGGRQGPRSRLGPYLLA